MLALLTALVLWWFANGLDWVGVRAAVSRADWRLIVAAVGAVCLTYLWRAYRWRALLRPLAPAVSVRELFAATTVGFGAVFVAGRAGEVVRPAFLPLRDPRVRPTASFVTIMVERIYDMATIIVFFALNLVWFKAPNISDVDGERVRQAGFLLFVAAVLGIAGVIFFRSRSGAIIGWVSRRLMRWPRVGTAITGLLQQLAAALGVLVHKRDLAVTIGWTLLLWATVALANWLILRAFGLSFGLSETIFVMGWALVGSMVPTPGGAAGAFHAATAAGLIFLGVVREQAAAVSIVTHLVVFAPALFIGLYYFLRSDVRLTRLRESASAKDGGDEVERESASVSEVHDGSSKARIVGT